MDGHVERNIFDDALGEDLPPNQPVRSEAYRRKRAEKHRQRMANLRMHVFKRDSFRCRDCHVFFPHVKPYRGELIDGLSLGHIVPRSKGGGLTRMNLIAQCIPCNQLLGNKVWEQDWQVKRGIKKPPPDVDDIVLPNWML
jgi:5-methylcytosine-specific restriction endonuclease McrA